MFAVGTRVSFARPGVGAVAVQGASEITWGPLALDILEQGVNAAEVINALMDGGPVTGAQFAVVDSTGAAAAFTSEAAGVEAGQAIGDGVSCRANLMEKDTVWDSMLSAYRDSNGAFEDRLLAALHAAEAAGGDIRGRQSAALLIVSGRPGERRHGFADDQVTDLRVDDHCAPVAELSRLLTIKRAHDHLLHLEQLDDVDSRVTEALAALHGAPDDALCQYAAVKYLATVGRTGEAVPLLRSAAHRDRRVLGRLSRYADSLPPATAATVRDVLNGV